MKVFRPFFVSLDLPYSIVRGEVVSIPVVVFNYFNEEVTAEVTIKNDGEFEFSDATNEVIDGPCKSKLNTFSRTVLPLTWSMKKKCLQLLNAVKR